MLVTNLRPTWPMTVLAQGPGRILKGHFAEGPWALMAPGRRAPWGCPKGRGGQSPGGRPWPRVAGNPRPGDASPAHRAARHGLCGPGQKRTKDAGGPLSVGERLSAVPDKGVGRRAKAGLAIPRFPSEAAIVSRAIPHPTAACHGLQEGLVGEASGRWQKTNGPAPYPWPGKWPSTAPHLGRGRSVRGGAERCIKKPWPWPGKTRGTA